MSTLVAPDKWVSTIEHKKIGKLAAYQVHFRIGSAQWSELPLGGVASINGEGLVEAPALSPGPLSGREFVSRLYGLAHEHFMSSTCSDGSHPKAADVRLVLVDEGGKTIDEQSQRLRRAEAQSIYVGSGSEGLDSVVGSSDVLSRVVGTLGSQLVTVTSVDARAKNEHESIMCQQMRTLTDAWKEVNADREKMQIDLVQAAEAKVRAQEESKRLDLERQLAEERTFLDSAPGQQLTTMLITQLVPKLIGFVDGALATATTGLEKRKLKSAAELRRFKRELEKEEKGEG